MPATKPVPSNLRALDDEDSSVDTTKVLVWLSGDGPRQTVEEFFRSWENAG